MSSFKPQKGRSSNANKGKGTSAPVVGSTSDSAAPIFGPGTAAPVVGSATDSAKPIFGPGTTAPVVGFGSYPASLTCSCSATITTCTTRAAYSCSTNMLNEVSQIPLADLGESHGHHSAASSTGLSTPESDDDDDIQQSEAKKRGRAPRPKKLPTERDPDGKPWAEPTTISFGGTAINKRITNILIGFLGTATFATWREVDKNTRGQMLKEFMNKVHIRPGFTEAQVRSGFGTKCSARWKEITKRIKGDYKPPRHDAEGQQNQADQEDQPDQSAQEHGPIFPSWVQSTLMEALFAHWNSKAFQDISERNTKNCGEGCAVHTGCSLTFQDHGRKMEIVDGAPVSIDRAYKQTHTHQFVIGVRLHDDEIKPWARPKYQKIHNKVPI